MTTVQQAKKRSSGIDPLITASVVVLLLFSIIMIGSANISSRSSVVSDVALAVVKQVVFIIVGFVSFILCYKKFSFKLVRTWIITALVLETGLLLVTRLFPPVGGAYAWIRLPGNITIQPSEFAKVLIILTVANFMCDIKNTKIKKAATLIRVPASTMFIYSVIIVVLQSDFGSGFAFFAIGCICCLLPCHKSLRKFQLLIIAGIVLVFVMTIVLMSRGFEEWIRSDAVQAWMKSGGVVASFFSRISYQFYRFISAGDPTWDRFGYSQELLNSLLGIARGNIRGVGLGNSIQKFGYLASSDADYIFPVIVEELGLLGIALVFVPYTIIFVQLIRYALKVKTEKEKVVLVGTVAYLFIHLFLNIGGVTAFIPLTGVPLVMLSRGGTSMISVLSLFGICQNIINKHNMKEQDNENNSW